MRSTFILTTFISALFAQSSNTYSSTNASQVVSAIQNAIKQKVNNHTLPANTNISDMKLLISNKVASPNVALGSYNGQFNVNNYNYQCYNGENYCDYSGYGFWSCVNGVWIYINCPPDTTCEDFNNTIYCNYPNYLN